MNDRDTQNDRDRIQDKSWEPSAPSAEEELKTEVRSLDIGESGQFAPGGYYNQQGVNQPDRSALDPDVKATSFNKAISYSTVLLGAQALARRRPGTGLSRKKNMTNVSLSALIAGGTPEVPVRSYSYSPNWISTLRL